MKIRKAIIPAAGLGTRFLPATKAQPKEMLPIVDKPTIQYIVEEAMESGIEDIIVVTGRGKRAIEDHFDKSYELEQTLEMKNKIDELEEVKSISDMANIHYIRQKEPLGLGHAISCASRFIGNEPFAVLLGDDVVVSQKPCLKQLLDVFDQKQSSVLGVQKVAKDEVSNYGIVTPNEKINSNLVKVLNLVEKPSEEKALSNLAIMGRYVLTPEIFEILAELPPGAGNEIQLTDAIRKLGESQEIFAYNFDGTRYDLGNRFGFVKATIDFALKRNDLRGDVLDYLNEVVEKGKV